MINTSKRFTSSIVKALSDEKSVIIGDCNSISFRDDFKSTIEEKLKKINYNRSLITINADCILSTQRIEDYFFENYFSNDIKGKYFPNKGYSRTQFIIDRVEFDLVNKYVWVTGIQIDRISDWLDFISNYCRLQRKNKSYAIFILEVDTNIQYKIKHCSIENYKDYVSSYDYYIYSMLISANSEIKNKALTNYAAEIASMLCNNNAEVCDLLMSDINRLVNDTTSIYGEYIGNNLQETNLNAIIWNAQIRHIFPVIELYRRHIVEKYETKLSEHLPYKTVYGIEIDDILELDLGNLFDIIKQSSLQVEVADYNKLQLYKNIRNDLAHLKPTNNQNLDLFFNLSSFC